MQLNQKKDSLWIVKWIGICALLHNFVIQQNDPWTEEDDEDPHAAAPEAGNPVRPAAMPAANEAYTRRDATAVSAALLVRVMDHAIAHHREAGTFEALGRE